jgi:dephospho-CoA kinase
VNRNPVLAVVGPAASGKSEVRRHLEQLGAAALDFDRYSNVLLQPGQEEYEAILRAWGTEYLLPGGDLDRAALARQVFSDAAVRQQLNAIVHPGMERLLREDVARFRAHPTAPALVVEGALLVWMGLASLFDKVILVTATRAARRQWLHEKGMPEELAGALLDLHEELGLAHLPADYRLHNHGRLEELRSTTCALWQDLVGGEVD